MLNLNIILLMEKIQRFFYFLRYYLGLSLVYTSATFSLYLTYPGAAYTDTFLQYRDMLSGSYGDWQVPIMIGLWGLLHKVFPWAPQNLFIFQLLLFLFGFHLLLAYFKQKPWIALGIGILCWTPPLLVSNAALWKDTHMLHAYVLGLASGLWALKVKSKTLSTFYWVISVLALFYGTGTRHNAAAALPFLLLIILTINKQLTPKLLLRSFGFTLILFFSSLLVSNSLTDRDYFPSQVIKSYDLVGMKSFGGDVEVPSFFPKNAEAAYNPAASNNLFFHVKPAVGLVFEKSKIEELDRSWKKAVLKNPLAYLKHKLKVFSIFLRIHKEKIWFYDMQLRSIPNPYGWGQKPSLGRMILSKVMRDFKNGVFFTPWIWCLVGLFLLIFQVKAAIKGSVRPLALLLNLSAFFYLVSLFPILPSAIDYRYFLYSYMAIVISGIIYLGDKFES